MLTDSAKTLRDAVESRIEAGRAMELHYDHPILMLQHMIWHEGYHHGQIKLALKRRAVLWTTRQSARSPGTSGCARPESAGRHA